MSSTAHVNFAQVAQTFDGLRTQLYAQFPDTRVEADRLASEIIDCETADAETIWSVLWDKPLYTNRKTSEAHQYIEALAPEMPGAWQRMTGKLSPYYMKRKTKRNWVDPMGKTNGSFEVLGRTVERWQDEIGLAYQFAFPIVNAGLALNERSQKSDRPFKDLAGVPLSILVRALKKEFVWGWGPITALHFLTDLGLAVKPDRHFVRTARHIGLYDCSSDDPSEKEALLLNVLILDLCREYFGVDDGAKLRTMDKNMMDISECGLLPQTQSS